MLPESPFKEEFLHFLWRTKQLSVQELVTTDNKSLEIIDFGTYNLDSGPDFFNAKIKINQTIWAGNIEMHVFSSDWHKHKHQDDKAYENVILHVVYENDKPVKIGERNIPTLELKGKIPKSFIDNYLSLMQSSEEIPCQKMIQNVSQDKINLWKYTLAIERLDQKSIKVDEIYHATNGDWEETLYIMMARYFGSKVNTEPFEILARNLPLSLILKNKDKKETLDALFFGQAGMLMANYKDEYFLELKQEYLYQQKKYNLSPINPVMWKFSRLRPMNFPTIRIAQFSGLMYSTASLFSEIKESNDLNFIKKLLKSQVHDYWDTHYRFGVESTQVSKSIGKNFVDTLLINAIAPTLFLYGKINNEEKFIEIAINILEHIPAEKNKITALWKDLKVSAESAFDSQALIQLKTSYCDQFQCLSCKIGNEIMNRS